MLSETSHVTEASDFSMLSNFANVDLRVAHVILAWPSIGLLTVNPLMIGVATFLLVTRALALPRDSN